MFGAFTLVAKGKGEAVKHVLYGVMLEKLLVNENRNG